MADVGEEENAGDYYDLFQYLSKQRYPENYSDNQKKTLRRKAKNFKYVDGFLYYYFNKTGLLHKVLLTSESRIEALAKAHKEADTGRHCGIQKTTTRLLNEFCFYWRGFTRDIKNFVKDCAVCTAQAENEEKEAGAIPSPTSKEEANEEEEAAVVDLDPSCNSQQTCSESEFTLAPSLQCPECSEHFTSKFSFRIHQRKHADGRSQSEVNALNETNSDIDDTPCENNSSPKPTDEKDKPQSMNSQGQPQPNMASFLLQDQMPPVLRNCISTSETFPTPSEPANSSHPPQPKDFSVPTTSKNDLVSQRGLGSFWAEMIDAIKVKEEKGDEKWWFNHNLKPEVWDMHTGPSSVAFPTSDPMNAHLARSYTNSNCLPVSTADYCQAQFAQDVLRMIPPESPSNQSVIASNSMNNGSSFQLTTVGSNNRVTCECPNCKGNSVSDGGVPNSDANSSSHNGNNNTTNNNNSSNTTSNGNNNNSSNNPNSSSNNNTTNNDSASGGAGCSSGTSKPPGRLHNCHIPGCTKVFKKSWHLKAHVRTHTGERPFQCQWPTCTKRFTRSDKLHRHMSVHTGERKFSCFVCNRRFVRSDCLTQHLRSHEIVVDNKTISCHELVKQESGGEGGITGDLTSVGSALATLTGGTATVLPAPSLMKFKVYPCPYAGCEKMFKKTWHLKAHVCSHTGEKPFICGWPMCGKRFTRSDKLNRHMNTHTDGKQFPCPLCNKRFVRSDYINHHIRAQHGKDPASYHYPTPKNPPNDNNNNDNNSGNSENTVFNHAAGPSQPPAFPHLVNCPPPPPIPTQQQQQQGSTTNENEGSDNQSHPNLMQSILCEQSKVHCPADHCPANHCPSGRCSAGQCPTAPPGDFGRPTKTYSCSMDGCEKIFKKSWHLKAHVRSHTGEKPFACNWPLCGKRFTRSDKLYRHALMHTDGKRFPCPLCQKRFVRSDNLNQHVKTHYKQAGRKDKCLKGRRKNLGLTYPPTLVTNPYPSYQANFITSL